MADGLLNKASIILTPTGYKAGTLYNVAPVVEPYEDFDFARASVASRVNSSGLVEMVGRTLSSELVTNGTFDENVNGWGTDSGATLTWQQDQTCLVATTADNTFAIIQGNVLTSSLKYKVSLRFKPDNIGRFRVRLGGSSTTFSTTSFNVNQWNYIEFEGVADNHVLEIGSQGGSITQFYIDNVSVKEVIDTNNIPRISYDSNGENGHILLEPTSTNLITYSEDFTGWNTSGSVTLTPNTSISPDGTQNASTLNIIDSTYFYKSISTGSGTFTLSCYVKVASGTNDFKMQSFSGTDGANVSGVYTATTEWQRFEHTVTVTVDSNFYPVFISSPLTGGEFEIWGAQVEELPYATSYIPTLTGSTVTRATETATGAGSADLINSTEGVLYAEISGLVNGGVDRSIVLSDGTTSNYLRITLHANSNRLAFFSEKGVNYNNYDFSQTSDLKMAFQYKEDDWKIYINGTLKGTDTSALTFSPNTLSDLSFSLVNTNPFYGKVKALAVFNEALSDSELTQLTT